jgi:hypothetical protein
VPASDAKVVRGDKRVTRNDPKVTRIDPRVTRNDPRVITSDRRSPFLDGSCMRYDSRSAPMRHEALLRDIQREFPSFAVVYKRDSALQRAIAVALALITVGGQRQYMTRYHTVLFGKLYVPDVWDAMDDDARYILLRHERVHLQQRRRMGDVAMAFVYLVPIFPLFLAWGRARIEWEAYVETIRATAEVRGIDAARRLEEEIVLRFTGPDYGWMWPFPQTVRRWFREAVADAEVEAPGG